MTLLLATGCIFRNGAHQSPVSRPTDKALLANAGPSPAKGRYRWDRRNVRPATADVPETDGPDSGPLKRPNASVAVKERSAAGQQPNSSAERADHNSYPNGSRVRLRRFDSWSHCSEKQYLHLASPAGGSVLLTLYLPPAVKCQPHLVFQR